MLRSIRRARLEARTTAVQRFTAFFYMLKRGDPELLALPHVFLDPRIPQG